MTRWIFRRLAFVFVSMLSAQVSFAADLALSQGGKVSIELVYSDAGFSNTLSIELPPPAVVAVNGCTLEQPGDPNLPGIRIVSEKLALRGCRATLDADGTVEGVQPFPGGTVLRFNMCAQTNPGPPCEYIWSSNAAANSDGFDHLRTTPRSDAAYPGRIFQLDWEDLPDGGDKDFNDLVAAVRVDVDSDGDGLWDDWETSGIDTNGDGTADLTLPGANPRHKDVYVEIDWMDCAVAGGDCTDTHSHRPDPAAIAAVVQAFADADVDNPDGTKGIRLHVDADNAIPHQRYLVMPGGCFPGVPGAGFDAVKSDPANFGPQNPRRFAYHYGLFTHSQTLADQGATGCAERPGNDFQVSLGAWENQVGTVMQQAGTLMHELGHNLGLRHGGASVVDFQPNYVSVMNHRYQLTGIPPTDPDGSGPLTALLDFSSTKLPDLDQTNLDENAGVGGSNTVFFFAPPVADDIGITVDGQGTDGAWVGVPTRNLAGGMSGSLRVQRSGGAIYLLVTANDALYHASDSVTVFLDPLHDFPASADDIELRIVRDTAGNPVHIKVANGQQSPWDPVALGSELGRAQTTGGWVVELKLTAEELGLSALPAILGLGIQADDVDSGNLAVWPSGLNGADASTWYGFNPCPSRSVQSAPGGGPVDWNCNGVSTDTTVKSDINGDGACVLAGANGVVDSVAAGDDIKAGNTIWNGPNLRCDTAKSGDDIQKLPVGSTEPNPLMGQLDWGNLQYDFQSTLSFEDGIHLPVDEPELERPTYLQQVAADLALSMTATPAVVKSGANVTYTLTIRNKKPGAAQNVLLTDVLSPATTFVSCAATAGGVCGGTGGSPAVSFGAIPGGGTAVVTIVANVTCEVANGTSIANAASVDFQSADPDPYPGDNSAAITVMADNPPPAIENVTLSRYVLWPPNHKMVDVLANYLVHDNCGVPVCALDVSSNEPIDGLGDGDTAPDWKILDAHRFRLRAERAGTGNGRVYTATIQCSDSAAGTSASSLAVEVPRSRGKSESRPDRRPVPRR